MTFVIPLQYQKLARATIEVAIDLQRAKDPESVIVSVTLPMRDSGHD